ncbi:MAG TPA: hypothetical protein VM784_14715 [Actinomycetota bacterium]|nr:hypothetical protein [Actinomycetota bacterium]
MEAGGGEWLEVRSTAAELLHGLGGARRSAPRGAVLRRGVLSIVDDDPSKQHRKLPSLYFKNIMLFSDRDTQTLREKTSDTISIVVNSSTEPTYLLHSCSVDGRHGLYARDFHNRSSYRCKLARMGVAFNGALFLRFSERGEFQAPRGAAFSPEFVITGLDNDDKLTPTKISGGLLTYLVVTRRLHRLEPPELRTLAEALEGVIGISAADPKVLLQTLKSI